MKYSVRKTLDLELIEELHETCFPLDDLPELEKSSFWVAKDVFGNPIGFAISKNYGHGIMFLSRAGVIPEYRGLGIHQRLIKTRIRYARSKNYKNVITYTDRSNTSSCNNLIAQNFRKFIPEYQWVGKDYDYWILKL